MKDFQRVSAGVVKGAPVALLENIGNSVAVSRSNRPFSDFERAKADRRKAWELRSVLWQESNLPAVQTCGKVAITESGEVRPVATGSDVFFSGVATCKSVWSCPCCSPRIHGRRRRDLALLFEKALESGSAAFGAYTLRHSRSDSLADLQQALSDCWSAVGRDWKVREVRERLGVLGIVKAVEHTYTVANGWHPHLHPVYVFAGKVSSSQVAELFDVEFGVWERAAVKAGLRAPMERGQNLHLVEISESNTHLELADYLGKGNLISRSPVSVAYEMAPGNKKTYTRTSGSLTPFDILEKISLSITPQEKSKWLAVWHEYERATKGRSALTYSKGLREHFGLRGVVRDESEIIKELELAEDTDFGFVLTDYVPIRKNYRLGSGLLNAISPKGNFEAGRAFCREHKLDFIDLLTRNKTLDYGNSRDVSVSKFVGSVVLPVVKVKSDWEQEVFGGTGA